ncbi:MAG TPA: asparagine synthetase B, partial [Bryobacteraceae bacterium]
PQAQPLFAALEDPNGFVAQYVSLSELKPLIARHLSNQEDATDRLWRLLNLQLWGDIFITGQRDKWWDGILSREPAAVA